MIGRIPTSSHKVISFAEAKRDTTTEARAGILRVNGFNVRTPSLWLGHNFRGPVRLWKGNRMRLPGLLVNACEVLSIPTVADSVRKHSIHGFLAYKGPVMMDSGGFLFQKSGNMSISADTISELYRETKIDIGVALDHPLNPALSSRQNRRRWAVTLRNTEIMAASAEGYAFMPVVHGYSLRDLKRACRETKLAVGHTPLIGLGSLVPLLKGSYLGRRFRYTAPDGRTGNHVGFIADALRLVRDEFPSSLLHVFGAGGTTTILSMFALGADSVDSVAWRLKAAYGAIQLPGVSDRFLSARPHSSKRRRVLSGDELELLARCNCPICAGYKSVGWSRRRLDSSFEARSIHNGWVYLQEVRGFRKALLSGKSRTYLGKRLSGANRLAPLLAGASNEE